jgi:hypothetical protein
MINPINRNAVIITPKQTFFNMLAGIMGEEPEKAVPPFTDDESTIYLIEESDLNEPNIKERLSSCYKEIFFEELEGWFTDNSKWPKDVSWKEFTSYFHISYQSTVVDTLDEVIEYE